ncbi:MAG: molecular chaperone TorD family protein, partial [Rhizobacter sp.]|nr:molecular chaperone TorD family protein [Rhizobacter sp.]
MAGLVPSSSSAAVPRRPVPGATDVDEEGAHAVAWGLLARLLLAPPDAELLAALGDGVGAAAAPIRSELECVTHALAKAALAVRADLVADEYAALFTHVGASRVDPRASSYLGGLPMEQPLAALQGDLAALGLGRARSARV